MRLKALRVAALAAGMIASSSILAAEMGLHYSWNGYPACSSSSPGFTVSGVPRGTVKLAFRMIDRNMPFYPHGGGTLAYEGKGAIRPGAFSYAGPCPTPGRQHRYTWTVRALDAEGNVLATANSTQTYPPR
jgi:phosphatidylethanolamine-binding protein (PEBP) family uncharacterized protein